MQISKKGRGIVAVVRSRQVAAIRESSDRFFNAVVSGQWREVVAAFKWSLTL